MGLKGEFVPGGEGKDVRPTLLSPSVPRTEKLWIVWKRCSWKKAFPLFDMTKRWKNAEGGIAASSKKRNEIFVEEENSLNPALPEGFLTAKTAASMIQTWLRQQR